MLWVGDCTFLYLSVHLCVVCIRLCVHVCARWTEQKAKWKKIRVIGADAARCMQRDFSVEIKDKRYRPGPDCQLLVITLIPQKQTQRPTNWMTDAHKKCTGQDVHWTQVYSLNQLLNLVVIWRDVSLYILWVILYSSLQSLARVTGRPSQNSGNKDGSVVKATVIQPASVGSSPICCLLRCPLATRRWYSTILQHPEICSMAMFF